MKKLILIAAASVAATQVSAGVRVESVMRDPETKAFDAGADVVLVQDGMVRSTHAGSPHTITLIKGATVYVLDDAKKTYYVMDEAARKKVAAEAAALLEQMQDRVKNMPPEQREMMEKSMGAHMPGVFGRKDTYEWKDTGRNDTVEGRECRVWTLLKNAVTYEEHCLVPYASLPGTDDFDKAFKDLWDSFRDLTMGVMDTTDYVNARKASNGYPVRVRSIGEDGQLRGKELVLTKWVEEAFPAETFEVPPRYKKKSAPRAGEF